MRSAHVRGLRLQDRADESDRRHCQLLRARRERPCCCAAEKRNELASLQLIELHSVPAAKPDGQDIELGWISQRLFGFDSSRLLADFSPSGAM